jgi:hypothetical protein
MGLVWWLMGALGPCLVVNGAWAVFSIWVVAQLTTVNGSVGLGFLPPQPRDSTPKLPPPQIQSPELTKLSPSLSAADGLVPLWLRLLLLLLRLSLQPLLPPSRAAAGAILLKASPHHSLRLRPGRYSDAIDAPPMP